MWKSLVTDKNKTNALPPSKTTKPKKKPYNAKMRRLSQFDGSGVANTPRLSLAEDLIPQVVDTSLFVGPVYDSTKRRQSVIKEQLGDITKRLHKTLHQYDVLDEVERAPPRLEILENVTRNLDTMDREELKGHLEGFMVGYKDLASSVEESNKEREELLMQVADWMTADHTDLENMKMSIDESEASEINSEYINTVADLEKLKSLKEEIVKCDFNGQNTKILEQEKKRLEKSVMEGLAEMKQNKQTGGDGKIEEDTHWKHAAGEVVQLLNKVRLENKDEKEELNNKMTELITTIDRQKLQIRSLQGDVRREKHVASHLADDNADLTKELVQLKAKISKYEKDLEQAKKVIERQLSSLSSLDDFDGSSTSLDMKAASAICQNEDFYSMARETSSDPAILRSHLRELKDNIESLTKELNRASSKMKEVELMNMELENKVEELENRPPEVITETTTIVNEVIVTKAPSYCECHIPKVEKKPSVNLELVAAQEEIEKLTEKNQYYKKALYDAEMKLSDAYKEIAELRVLVDKYETEPSPVVVKEVSPVQPPPTPEPPKVEEKKVVVVEEEVIVEEVKEPEPIVEEVPPAEPPKMKKGSITEPPKIKPKQAPPKPKPVRKPAARKPPQKKAILPPIRHKNPPPPIPDMDEIARSEREDILWTVGELQAMLNGIVQDIMEFSTLVGNMIYKEKEEEQIQQPALKTFDFAQNSAPVKIKGKKPITDRKELEAKDKKSQVFFLGQRAVGTVREIYDILSSSLELLHEEFEMIYRSFKEIQQRKALEKALLSGQLPENIKLPGHEATGGPGTASMKFHGATTEALLTYYIHAYGQLQKTRDKKGGIDGGRSGGYMLSEKVTTEHRSKSLSVTSISSDNPNTMHNAVMVLGIHRSKSEVDINSVLSNDSTTSVKRSQTHLFVSTKAGEHIKPEMISFTREEARVATTTVPKKGLIKLTAMENELDGTFNFGLHERNDASDLEDIERQRRKHSLTQGKQKMLIRRKEIQDQILAGKQILDEEERQKEEQVDMEKALEEYTVGELSQNITQYVGKKKTRSGVLNTMSKGKVYEQEEEPKQQRTITLPAINTLNINVFGS